MINKKYHMLDQHHYLLPIKFTILFCCLASFFANFPSISLLFRKRFKFSSDRLIVVDVAIDSCFAVS